MPGRWDETRTECPRPAAAAVHPRFRIPTRARQVWRDQLQGQSGVLGQSGPQGHSGQSQSNIAALPSFLNRRNIQQRLDIDAQLAQIDQAARHPELEAAFVNGPGRERSGAGSARRCGRSGCRPACLPRPDCEPNRDRPSMLENRLDRATTELLVELRISSPATWWASSGTCSRPCSWKRSTRHVAGTPERRTRRLGTSFDGGGVPFEPSRGAGEWAGVPGSPGA
jgi:hypothetical protein